MQSIMSTSLVLALFLAFGFCKQATAAPLEVGQVAPDFTLKNQDGTDFKLSTRKGAGWTVLYFYPKADSPGCTEQACAFRDTIKRIRAKNTELYGISTDSIETQKAFHTKHSLIFDLLSDSEKAVSESYGVKRPLIGFAKRWTFMLDPQLIVRSVEKDVDPAFDADWTVETLDELQNPTPTEKSKK